MSGVKGHTVYMVLLGVCVVRVLVEIRLVKGQVLRELLAGHALTDEDDDLGRTR